MMLYYFNLEFGTEEYSFSIWRVCCHFLRQHKPTQKKIDGILPVGWGMGHNAQWDSLKQYQTIQANN